MAGNAHLVEFRKASSNLVFSELIGSLDRAGPRFDRLNHGSIQCPSRHASIGCGRRHIEGAKIDESESANQDENKRRDYSVYEIHYMCLLGRLGRGSLALSIFVTVS